MVRQVARLAALTATLTMAVNGELVYVDQNEHDWYLEPLALMMVKKGIDFNPTAFAHHGCWCAATQRHGGQALSSLDQLCHQLSQCLKCVEMQEICGVESYFWVMDIINSTNTRRHTPGDISCRRHKHSQNACHKMKCECAQATLTNIVTYLEENAGAENEAARCDYDNKESSSPGGGGGRAEIPFNLMMEKPDILLKGASGLQKPSSGNDACCGAHPNWFPYNTHAGERGCCNGKTYNKNSLKCCASTGTITGVSALCETPVYDEADNTSIEEEDDGLVILPTCHEAENLMRLADGTYVCEQRDQCRSTEACAYSLVPGCTDGSRLVSYKMDLCCSYFYCAPFVAGDCSAVTCQASKECGTYQQPTTSLSSFTDCCPQVECVCDYNKCKRIVKPQCPLVSHSLLTKVSEDGCCDEYECVLTIQDGGSE